jgi:thiamine biosynthesis lipoprotein
MRSGRTPANFASDGRYAMGTVLEITLAATRDDVATREIDALYEAVESLEARLSNWRTDSDVSRLAAAAGEQALEVDRTVSSLLARCVEWTRLTRGTFDVTVGPLVNLWRDAGLRGTPPSESALYEARALVDAGTLLRIDENASRVALLRPGMSIDVGGVAKGRALDVAAARLGPGTPALLSFGQSSVRAVGAPPDAPGWRVLLRRPDEGFAGVVTLRDQSLSVSGSLGQWTEIGGRRYGHVIDPRNGRPLERRLAAAVLAPDATFAEALSKALLILGEQEGIALLESLPDVEGWIADDGGHEWVTRGWSHAVAWEPVTPVAVDPARAFSFAPSVPVY